MDGRMNIYVDLHTRVHAHRRVDARTRRHTLPYNVIALLARLLWYALLYRLYYSCVRPAMTNATSGHVAYSVSP